MTWQFTLDGPAARPDRRPDGHGRRVADDADPDHRLRLQAERTPSAPTSSTARSSSRSARCATGGSARCTRHLALWMFAGSGPLALAGVVVADLLRNSISNAQTISATRSAWRSSRGGVGFLAKSFVKRGDPAERGAVHHEPPRQGDRASAIGAVFGFIVGMTSVGSGTYFGLMMVLVYPLTMPRIVGTDIFHAAALLWVAGVGHLVIGNVDLHATALAPARLDARGPHLEPLHGEGAGPDASAAASAGILIISGLKLLNVPEANWILGGGARPHARRPHDLHREGDAERVARRSRTRLTALQLR